MQTQIIFGFPATKVRRCEGLHSPSPSPQNTPASHRDALKSCQGEKDLEPQISQMMGEICSMFARNAVYTFFYVPRIVANCVAMGWQRGFLFCCHPWWTVFEQAAECLKLGDGCLLSATERVLMGVFRRTGVCFTGMIFLKRGFWCIVILFRDCWIVTIVT